MADSFCALFPQNRLPGHQPMRATPPRQCQLTSNRLGCRVSIVPGNHAGNSRFRGAIPAAHLCFGTLAAPPLWYPGFHLPLFPSCTRAPLIITPLAAIVGANLPPKDSSGTAAGSAARQEGTSAGLAKTSIASRESQLPLVPARLELEQFARRSPISAHHV
jgi:hypothetical protein